MAAETPAPDINDQIVEKDITLALAFRIRSLLAARGFTVAGHGRGDSDAAASPRQRELPLARALPLDDRCPASRTTRLTRRLLPAAARRRQRHHASTCTPPKPIRPSP